MPAMNTTKPPSLGLFEAFGRKGAIDKEDADGILDGGFRRHVT
jgi:hypothetical protein